MDSKRMWALFLAGLSALDVVHATMERHAFAIRRGRHCRRWSIASSILLV